MESVDLLAGQLQNHEKEHRTGSIRLGRTESGSENHGRTMSLRRLTGTDLFRTSFVRTTSQPPLHVKQFSALCNLVLEVSSPDAAISAPL